MDLKNTNQCTNCVHEHLCVHLSDRKEVERAITKMMESTTVTNMDNTFTTFKELGWIDILISCQFYRPSPKNIR